MALWPIRQTKTETTPSILMTTKVSSLKRRYRRQRESIQYSYDAVGNRNKMTDATGTSVYSYDKNNRLQDIKKAGVNQISYTYDTIGNIQTVTDKMGYSTNYTYDKSSRMKSVSFNGNTVNYAYDENGNRKSITYQGGVSETYTFDKNNRLINLLNKKTNGSIISKFTYTYDIDGKELTKTDNFGTTKYSYDKEGRILGIKRPERPQFMPMMEQVTGHPLTKPTHLSKQVVLLTKLVEMRYNIY